MRESTKFMLLVTLGLLVGVVLVVSVSCGGNSPTNVVDEFAGSGSGVTQSVTPTPAPSPTPSPVPVGTVPYIEFNKDPKDGSGTMFNPTNHPVTFTIEYFNATDFNKQVLLLAVKYVVDPKSSKELLAAVYVLPPMCGITMDLQVDASTTTHLGHVIFRLTTEECRPCESKELEPEITYTEWSECKTDTAATTCSQSRTKTTVIKEKNICTGEIREKSRKVETETRPCECACVAEWKEIDPVVTYGEWGECKAVVADSACAHSRTKTTIIREQNTCTNEIRIKSSREETQSEPCECACIPAWEKQEPIYGSWTEWSKGTCGERTRTVTYTEKNTCTGEVRTLKVDTEKETKECQTECKATIPSEPYCENSNPENECSYYGLDFLGKVESGFLGPKWFGNPPIGTSLVIVKAGSCQSTDNRMHALYYPPYTLNQMFISATGKEISHITFCGCVED